MKYLLFWKTLESRRSLPLAQVKSSWARDESELRERTDAANKKGSFELNKDGMSKISTKVEAHLLRKHKKCLAKNKETIKINGSDIPRGFR